MVQSGLVYLAMLGLALIWIYGLWNAHCKCSILWSSFRFLKLSIFMGEGIALCSYDDQYAHFTCFERDFCFWKTGKENQHKIQRTIRTCFWSAHVRSKSEPLPHSPANENTPTHRHIHIQTQTQTDRQTDTHTHMYTHTHTHTPTHTHTHTHTQTRMHTQVHTQTNKQTMLSWKEWWNGWGSGIMIKENFTVHIQHYM